ATLRDLAVGVRAETLHEEVEKALREGGGDLLESVRLFDIYQGKEMAAAGEKSLAYSLVFRLPARTLTDAEVNAAFSDILSLLKERLGARLRA
ncbi:MAG: phenylalanine--tRNA ligase subunit beta, partial [bacterium]|nr:phenylalanine--tRNA ligase subunit beta [bacterium]